jgi:hypothetical protein
MISMPALIALLLPQMFVDTPAAEKPALLLSVALPAVHGQRPLHSDETFAVVVMNASDKPASVWREWCSWGYHNLSLEFRDKNGKEWSVTKQPHEWTRNFPDFAELAPGESIIFYVKLTEDVWENLPPLKELAGKKIKMRVRYEIGEDADTKRENVWTGKLESAFQEYTVAK